MLMSVQLIRSLPPLGTLATAATTTVNGITVHFKEEVVNVACAVDAGSVDQTVRLGQVRTVTLGESGKTSSTVGVNFN